MTTTTPLKQQIAALHQLEETKEAKKWEEAHKKAEAAAEKACEEEQCRLQAEAKRARHDAEEHARHDAEERHVEQERREREEEEEAAQQHRLHEESVLTPLAAPEMELPKSKGKGPELAPESEGGQKLWRCDSCEKQKTGCICLKVHGWDLGFKKLLTTLQTGRSHSCHLCQELRIQWSSGPAEKGVGGGPW